MDVDLIRLYYFDASGDEVILLTGSDKELYVEIEKSKEAFIDRIYKNEKFYMDACYKNSCQKMELSYFNDFSNDNLINNEIKNKSVKTVKENIIKNKTDLIEELIQNDFKFN